MHSVTPADTSDVAVAHLRLAKCTVNPLGDGIAKPEYDAEKKYGEG